jgi:hypothetical protein
MCSTVQRTAGAASAAAAGGYAVNTNPQEILRMVVTALEGPMGPQIAPTVDWAAYYSGQRRKQASKNRQVD